MNLSRGRGQKAKSESDGRKNEKVWSMLNGPLLVPAGDRPKIS